MVFYERASGARLHANYFRPGGVHLDCPPSLLDDIAQWCGSFPKVLDDMDGFFIGNRIFKQRNADVGTISLEQCWARGLSGPVLRASGAA